MKFLRATSMLLMLFLASCGGDSDNLRFVFNEYQCGVDVTNSHGASKPVTSEEGICNIVVEGREDRLGNFLATLLTISFTNNVIASTAGFRGSLTNALGGSDIPCLIIDGENQTLTDDGALCGFLIVAFERAGVAFISYSNPP